MSSNLAIIFSIMIGIITYVVGVLMIPKRITSEGSSSFTRRQLKDLESDDIGLAYERENDLSRDRFQSTGPLARVYYSMPLGRFSHPYIVRGGMANNVDQIFLICFGAFIIALLTLSLTHMSSNPVIIFLVSIAFAYFIGWRVIVGRIKSRVRAFINQFPDALDIIVRSVKSGFPLNAAVNMVSESMPAPASEEFRQMSNEVVHGSTLVDALDRLGKRMQTADIRFFVVVLTLQQEVGGSLAEVLSNLSLLIRKRKMMQKKIFAITAEGRITGWILGSLPLLVALAIQAISPGYLDPLYSTSTGHFILGITVVTILVGVLIIRKMVDLEI